MIQIINSDYMCADLNFMDCILSMPKDDFIAFIITIISRQPAEVGEEFMKYFINNLETFNTIHLLFDHFLVDSNALIDLIAFIMKLPISTQNKICAKLPNNGQENSNDYSVTYEINPEHPDEENKEENNPKAMGIILIKFLTSYIATAYEAREYVYVIGRSNFIHLPQNSQ